MRKMSAKQWLFCAEYLTDLNATQAAIRAGYSTKTASRIGPELLGKTCIQARVEELKARRAEKCQVTAEWVLEQYRQVWEAQITDILEEKDGELQLRRVDEWPEIWRKMTTPAELRRLKKRSQDGKDASWDDVGVALKMNCFPKAEALHRIGEHVFVKAFPKDARDINISVTVESVEQKLLAAREKAAESQRVH